MFGLFRKKEEAGEIIGAPISGKLVSVREVPDVTFAQELLGKGVAILPSEGKVYAPCDGTVLILFETKHAVSIESAQGAEILIHIGIDTVELKGTYYKAFTQVGAEVKKGDLLIEFDLEKIQDAGYSLITPVVVCNTRDFRKIDTEESKDVQAGEQIMHLVK